MRTRSRMLCFQSPTRWKLSTRSFYNITILIRNGNSGLSWPRFHFPRDGCKTDRRRLKSPRNIPMEAESNESFADIKEEKKKEKKGRRIVVDRRPVIYRDSIAPSKRCDNALSDKDKKGRRVRLLFSSRLRPPQVPQGYEDMIHAWLSRNRAIIVIW